MRHGAPLTIEARIALILLAAFALDAALVATGATVRFDRLGLDALRGAWFAPAALVLTRLGDGAVRVPLVVVAGALLLAFGRRRDAALLVGATVSGIVALALLKAGFGRARPDLAGRLIVVGQKSFPSGHAMGSMITYPLLGHAIGRRIGLAAGIAVAVLIGGTRVVVGVHWPSDVIGGWLIGGAWSTAALALARR